MNVKRMLEDDVEITKTHKLLALVIIGIVFVLCCTLKKTQSTNGRDQLYGGSLAMHAIGMEASTEAPLSQVNLPQPDFVWPNGGKVYQALPTVAPIAMVNNGQPQLIQG